MESSHGRWVANLSGRFGVQILNFKILYSNAGVIISSYWMFFRSWKGRRLRVYDWYTDWWKIPEGFLVRGAILTSLVESA